MKFNITLCKSFRSSTHGKMVNSNPWRDSASLILVAPTPTSTSTSTSTQTSNTNAPNITNEISKSPNFLMMERSKTSSFMPSALCFPGGAVSKEDASTRWIDLFNKSKTAGEGCDLRSLKLMKKDAHIPSIYNINTNEKRQELEENQNLNQSLSKDISLRITAIRETFEECGILLCKSVKNKFTNEKESGSGSEFREGEIGNLMSSSVVSTQPLIDEKDISIWQSRVREDAGEFVTLCETLNCVPDLNALVEWNNWLTPNFFTKRFDTIFYMTLLPHVLPVHIDSQEVAYAQWCTADALLRGKDEGKYLLLPPQIYEITRLQKMSSLQQMERLMKLRLELGIKRWCNCCIKTKDGILYVLQGDDLYPEQYDIYTKEDVRKMDFTFAELRASTVNYHRIEMRQKNTATLLVNIKAKYGHIYTL